MAKELNGPRLEPARGPAAQLVVLCHGYGADGNDLIGLASHWRHLLPDAAFVAPNAPAACPGAGYQWFALSRIDPHELETGVEAAAPGLGAFLDAELARLGLGPESLALVGFSQGAMLALALGLSRKLAAVVGFSGLLAGPAPAALAGQPAPIFLAHGEADQVIPPEAMFRAAALLGRAGARVQWHLAPGVGHGIDPVALDLAGGFLSLAFQGRLDGTGPAGSALPRP